MKTLTISLSPQQISRLQEEVETGAHASNSEVDAGTLLAELKAHGL